MTRVQGTWVGWWLASQAHDLGLPLALLSHVKVHAALAAGAVACRAKACMRSSSDSHKSVSAAPHFWGWTPCCPLLEPADKKAASESWP